MSNNKEGWLKVKLNRQNKWHRRYCIIDWDKAVLFIALKADTRYKDWIKLLPNIIINDFEYSFNNELNNHNLPATTIEIIADSGTARHYLQTETKKDCDSWLVALKRAAFSRIGGAIFGQSLEATYKYTHDKSSSVPLIVRQCCEYLLEHGSTFVGLFRVPGKQSSIKELRDIYDRGLPITLANTYSPATISSLLKHYLQSLPEPIIPLKCFDEFLEIGLCFKNNETNDLDRLKQLIESRLPSMSYAVLAYLCLFLKKLTHHVETTKMDTDNLAVAFGNNLIRPADDVDLQIVKGHSYSLLPLIKVLINQSEYLFPTTVNNQVQDSLEQTNDSITKSSGFSSFSSLTSAHGHFLAARSRSSSMPSLCLVKSASAESENESEGDDSKPHQVIPTDIPADLTPKEVQICQPPTEPSKTHHVEFETDLGSEDKFNNEHQPFGSVEHLNVPKTLQSKVHARERLSERIPTPKDQVLENSARPLSMVVNEATARKLERKPSRKGLANKLGKSISSLKLSMSKALQNHMTSSDNDSLPPNSSPDQNLQRTYSDAHSVKKLTDIDKLNALLDRKELLIAEMTRNYHERCLQFDAEKSQLNKIIEELRNENMQLKKQLNIQ